MGAIEDGTTRSERPRGKRLQIHLSTAVVMMFVAGGIIWANVQEKTPNGTPPVVDPNQHIRFSGTQKMREEFFKEFNKPHYSALRGWPFPITGTFYTSIGRKSPEQPVIPFWMPTVDVLVALAILFVVWFFCEWLIRRRAARKEV